jgi:hypothetical protein
MADMSDDENWLHAEHIACPHCGEDLYRIDHSPLYDDSLLYCDQCANRVEVSLSDPVVTALAAERPAPDALLRAVEERLAPCACGGRFRDDAARRCHACLAPVIAGAPAVDLWPGFVDLGGEEEEPAEEVAARINAFDAAHIRRHAIWRDMPPA